MIQLVRGLNKPYRRIDFIIEGFCMIIDGFVHIFSFGYIRSGLQFWWTHKTLHRGLSYIENKIKKGEELK